LKLSDFFERLVDEDVNVGFRAYDGSVAGPAEAETVVELRSPLALRYLLTSPGELGLARAYVTGALEIHGDLHAALTGLLTHRRIDVRPLDVLRVVRGLGRSALRPPPIPEEEAPPPWRRSMRRHTRERDAAAIEHHYDLSNRFYERLLGPTMTYSCAVFREPDSRLDEAQVEKVDLICRKLDLRPGQRLLDVGAGWGALIRHAAEHYGVSALGVTLSEQQVGWARRAIDAAGLAARAEIRHLDYRDVRETGFDAISSVGTMEHIGSAELGGHFTFLSGKLRPEGRILNHTITRPSTVRNTKIGGFNDRYIFPDGELQGPSTVVGAMHDHGFEVRHSENLREHYAMTLREWGRNLERHWGPAVAEVGERRARAWRLYMAVSRIAFETNRVEIHQFLGVRTGADGRSAVPLRPWWGESGTTPAPAPQTADLAAGAPRRILR
jgi:cyclopropane-fatty-acyl-phospholipid synthase